MAGATEAILKAEGKAPQTMLSGSGSAFIVAADNSQHAKELEAVLGRSFPPPARVRACRTLPSSYPST
jgi:4-diphosphocytidyl-2C-methyl-D-erythritol kinase